MYLKEIQWIYEYFYHLFSLDDGGGGGGWLWFHGGEEIDSERRKGIGIGSDGFVLGVGRWGGGWKGGGFSG